jgi:alkanesulfonate monooxygenase SsuD/methylene tetrahydromethanopterin reductase-like flavin-dependent oxidoreductase (luciferase family)
MAVQIGLNVWSRLVEQTFPYLDQTSGPFDSLWFPDHLQYSQHKVGEGWSLMAYALARYPDKLCGHEVLCNGFRNPAHLAKMVATAQALSGGRVILGLGAGWNEEEFLAYGWPFPKTSVRIAQLAEAIELIRLMWAKAGATYQGRYYQVNNAYCEPRPDPVPPIMVGGGGEKYLLRVVARHADWWNYPFRGREEYGRKQEALKQHCREVGRDYDAIQKVLRVGILIAETEGEIARIKGQPHVRPIEEDCLVGTPTQVTEALLEMLKQGADRLTVHFSDAPRPEGTNLFTVAVLPHLFRP